MTNNQNNTFSAKETRKTLASTMCDEATELEDYSGYICDAITELADSNTNIYTADQVKYAMEHDDDVNEALFNGLAMSGRDYFEANPNHTWFEYTAHIGACAEYTGISNRLYGDLEEAVEYAVLGHLANVFGDQLNAKAYEDVETGHCIEWDDNNATLEDILDECEEIYRDSIGEER